MASAGGSWGHSTACRDCVIDGGKLKSVIFMSVIVASPCSVWLSLAVVNGGTGSCSDVCSPVAWGWDSLPSLPHASTSWFDCGRGCIVGPLAVAAADGAAAVVNGSPPF